jgi:hypothetical protein
LLVRQAAVDSAPGLMLLVRGAAVVSAPGCCSLRACLLSGSPGFESCPAPFPWFSPGKPKAKKAKVQIFQAQQQKIPAQQQACQQVTKDEYSINTVDRKLQNK